MDHSIMLDDVRANARLSTMVIGEHTAARIARAGA
jgi:hypothetical protein